MKSSIADFFKLRPFAEIATETTSNELKKIPSYWKYFKSFNVENLSQVY